MAKLEVGVLAVL